MSFFRQNLHCRRGFTYPQTAVILLFTGALVYAAVPRGAEIQVARARAGMNLICSAMRAAQAQAMTGTDGAGILFDAARNQAEPSRPKGGPAPVDLNDVNTTGVTLIGVEGRRGADNAVFFDGSGRPQDKAGRPYGPDATLAVSGGGRTVQRTVSECLEVIR